MHKKQFAIASLIVTIILFGSIQLNAKAAPTGKADAKAQLRLSGYSYDAQLNVHNNDTATLPNGYTVNFSLDTAALITLGRLQSDCDDLRVTFSDVSEVELDRLVTGCNSTSTQVTFRTQASIDPAVSDTRYALNYDNASAVNPPQDKTKVFAYFDDFQDGNADGWTVGDGTWGIYNDSGNYLYRYTGGGTNWAIAHAVLAESSNLDYLAKIRGDDSPVTNWIGLAFRIQDAANFLAFYQSRDVSTFKYTKIINDQHTPVETPFSMAADSWYWLRVQALGSTVRARIWADGDSEPSSWILTQTETRYQSNSGIGLTLYQHVTNADWDDIQVRRLASVEPSVTLVAWWDPNYPYRRPIMITNTSASATLPLRFSGRTTLDTSALIAGGVMQEDCDDLRVVYDPGLNPIEIDRVVENCNSAQTVVWFALQRPIVASGQDTAYKLYYGNSLAGTPPANGMNVFLFFEDWEKGTAHWINAGGLDTGNHGTMGDSTISTEQALSPTHSQRMGTFGSGGDGKSGSIPVTPSTLYALSVWGRSTNTNVCGPLGFDWFNTVGGSGTEVWLWTSEWRYGPQWDWHELNFTTTGTANYIKIKDEIWSGCPSYGQPPLYFDNIALRYSFASAPSLALEEEETTLPPPLITNILDTDPVALGSTAQVTADISTAAGTITSATLQILSPVVIDIPMIRISGDTSSGTWQAGTYTPTQGGLYTYRVRAISSIGLTRVSAQQTFTVADTAQPVITLVSVIDPILLRNTQTLVVTVTDNGMLSGVTVTVDGATHPMVAGAYHHYSYSWQVNTAGIIPYTVTASDTSTNTATLAGSFVAQPLEVDVCTWKDCRQGAASWSIDDGNNACYTELNNAGIRGTYFYSGGSTQGWFSTYSAAGHEIASHTVGHPCDTPACSPSCTEQSLAALAVDPAVVSSYRLNQIEPNIAAIEAGTGKPVLSLAWPCGCTDPSRWTAAQSYVLGARGYYDYVAQLAWLQDINQITPSNLYNLATANSYSQTFIDQAYTEGKWATITSHGSCDGISYIGQQSANGHLWVAPIGEVLKYIYVRNASQLTNYSRVDRTISFDAVHNLSTFDPVSITTPTPINFLPIYYDNPVTLKVHILEGDTVLDVTVGGVVVPHVVQTINGVRYVTFDAALNTSMHVVVNLAAPAPAVSEVSDTDPVELGANATVTATVVPSGGTTLASVTLRITAPSPQDIGMALISGNQYGVSLTPAQLGTYSYVVRAANTEGGVTESAIGTFLVRDTTAPSYQNQGPVNGTTIANRGQITLTVQASDLGMISRAVLSTDESGSWQDFDWPVTNWWNTAWLYRKSVTITNAEAFMRPYHLVDLVVSQASYPGLTSCYELRVADSDRVEQPVQLYGDLPTCHLLFQASVPASSSRVYYIYYGNATAPVPSYTTDLTATNNSGVITLLNTYWNLDLDSNSDAGIISRIRLPLGTNTNLPLSTEANVYWGWHQVCATGNGNITGRNSYSPCGPTQASGLTLTETLTGPLVREYTLTSEKASSTYTIVYRFFANSPYYQYALNQTGTTHVMNNFWLLNGNYPALGSGMDGGAPYPSYNTYSSGADHLRIASQIAVDAAQINGEDNDGTDLGGTDYYHPTASSLSLNIGTAANQSAAGAVLNELAAPLEVTVAGTPENRPNTVYDSPAEVIPATSPVTLSFSWENDLLSDRVVQWHVNLYDVSGNHVQTPDYVFIIGSPTAVTVSDFRAEPGGNEILVRWQTATEIGLTGFNLYRSASPGEHGDLLASIPAQHPGQLLGASYEYTDPVTEGETRYYWLEVVGTGEWLGPLGPLPPPPMPFKVMLPLLTR